MTKKYETVIGLEVHVELATETKMFCSCKNSFGDTPNTNVCPVCMGLPGTLPSPNAKAVEFAIAAGLATECEIAKVSRFDRKNYFYPDLPKGYQISQYEYPICQNGSIEINIQGEKKRIGITRIHLEEDAGKLIHNSNAGTLIDYNRCGVPLIEIVSEPDMRSAEEARAFLTELRTILLYTGISDCKMNEGSFRCDVNLSVRPIGQSTLGTRTEMKNINSFSFVAKAIEYEAQRQINALERGESIVNETRRFDSKTGQTHTMRVKESAADYRFFPEPDIPPFSVSEEQIKKINDSLPILPSRRRELYSRDFGIAEAEAAVISSSPQLASFFESTASLTAHPRIAANILLCDILEKTSAEAFVPPITYKQLAELSELYGNQTINSSTVKKLLGLLQNESDSVSALVDKHSLAQINDLEYLSLIFNSTLNENPKLKDDYKNGKLAVKKAVIGKIMAKTAGRANPILLDRLWEKFTQEN